ncbi:hypothetical protein BHE97_07475 [Aeromicrobium sp. PE09-221]|uniref:class I SAM-dependent methyltransferase n=1 Tax=Aeromicrobium sp. PE09-221 TaxID=1898043 RepID=UPI000B3E8AEF|nr:class I SAM-dependent methyltransferase [Aeromicrobium sp. PE09-221]OUZ10411.1 hypothetical protein BHE97_07475 [Aeromicrobium sp. PE09-221]
MDLATFEHLLTPAGQRLLAAVAEEPPDTSDLALGTRLRREHPGELVAAAITQQRLRAKAVAKLGPDAAHLYYTPDALEQATRAPVARHRAEQLRDLGARTVVDLGCGIGADLIAFARAGLTVRGIEIDPLRAAIARGNLSALGIDGQVEAGDALETPISEDEVAFVDPARRDGSGRLTRLDQLTPPWEWIARLLDGRAVAKVMPGIAHDAIPPGVGVEWVSDRGDLVEACLWGAGWERPERRATSLPSAESISSRGVQARLAPPRRFIVEPDDAVIRAGLVAELGERIDGGLLDPKIAYLTCDTPPSGNLGRWFEIVEELPFRAKSLRAALRERNLGTLTIKKRGVDIVPERLIAQLKPTGDIPATLVVTRVAGKGRAFWVRPVR